MAEVETGGADSGRLPQATEEVHLPDPSYLPVIVAVATMITLVGIVKAWPVAAIGAVILLVAIGRWIRLAREELRELPLEHQ
ncbi:MAG: hypothetical protein QOJ07_2459 [Thermoleophilaceae bacterium]|jgi:hypothetical protein|nr:hypothetical protein [Thermoleophilaceae bacterium]